MEVPALHAPAAQERMRNRLIAWCAISSGSDDRGGLDAMLAALRADFARLPGALSESPCGPVASALGVRCRPEAPVQALLVGHYDTVYGPEHPFRGATLEDPDTLVGPGVLDMKGGIVVMLAALEVLEAEPGAEGIGWEVLLTPDEEIGSPYSRTLLAESAARNDVGLVFEPAQPAGRLVRSRPGTGIVSIEARGHPAHAGRNPHEGRNAIVALADLLARVPALAPQPDVLLNVGSVAGGGPPNVVAEHARAEVDLRVRRAADVERTFDRLMRAADEVGRRHEVAIDIDVAMNRPPMEADERSERLFAAYRGCAGELGTAVDWVDTGGGSDANLLAAAGLPCLDGLGARGGLPHSSEEFCELSSLPERAAIAALLLARLATGAVARPGRR